MHQKNGLERKQTNNISLSKHLSYLNSGNSKIPVVASRTFTGNIEIIFC